MTIYVHRDTAAIAYGDHSHPRPNELPEDQRTWSFNCTPECEQRVLLACEHTARSAESVPETPAEKNETELINRGAARSWGELMAELSGLAKDRARQRVDV